MVRTRMEECEPGQDSGYTTTWWGSAQASIAGYNLLGVFAELSARSLLMKISGLLVIYSGAEMG